MASNDEKKPLIAKDAVATASDGNNAKKKFVKDLPDYIEEAEPLSATGKIVLSSVLVACLAAAFMLPYYKYRTLMGFNRVITDVGLDKCQKYEGPAYCEEVHLDRPSGLAFLSCDPYRPIWYPVLGIEREDMLKGNGEIWVQELNKNTPPKQLPFSNYNASFHPLGLTIIPKQKGDSDDKLTLLVVNQPNSDESTVEIFDYTLSGETLSHVETLTSINWINLNRIAVDNIQWGTTPEGRPIPSFYVNQHHGYLAKDKMMRTIEDFLYLPIGKIQFYNARSQDSRHIIWRLNNPSGLATDLDGDDGKTVFVASATQGAVERYVSTVVSREHQFEYKFNEHTGKTDEIYWPGMVVQETIEWKIVPQGLDIVYFPSDPSADELLDSERVVFAAVQAEYFTFQTYARALEAAYSRDPASAQDIEAKISVRLPPSVIYRSFQERVWANGTAVSAEQEEDDEFDIRFTRIQTAITTVLADAQGKKFRGATGVAVDPKRGKFVVVGAYEKGVLVCDI